MLQVNVRRLPHETWAKVNEDYYISNRGRWYSVRTQKLIVQAPNSAGYLRATVSKDGKQKHLFTHIKVVELFGDCNDTKLPAGLETLRELGISIDHLDRNKNNNRQSNLEIVTHSENCKRKFL